MGILFPPNSSAKRKRVIRELVQGHDYATQLKFLLQNPIGPDGSLSAKELLSNVLRSFSETLSMLTSSQPATADDEVSGEDTSHVANIDLKSSEDSTLSRKRSLLPITKDRRGSYKRRKTDQTWTVVARTTDDKYAWRKYGQKEILNSQFPRSYFRCTRKFEQGCRAIKQVQRIQESPDTFNITYIGFHTCKDSLKAPQMATYSETWDSYLENSHPCDSNVPNEQQDAPVGSQTPIIKQEYPNDETDLSDLTDANLWSDLKDFELSKDNLVGLKIASENADTVYSCTGSRSYMDFCIFSSHFGTDDFHFDESQLL